MKKIALIGSGNPFFKDEGVGLYAAKYIKENYLFSPEVEIVDGGILGFKLMTLLQEFDEVIILNTASDKNKRAGEISVETTNEFLDGSIIKKTANEVEIAEMLQVCLLAENIVQTTIISVIPDDIISVEVSLSEIVKESWQEYIDVALLKLQSLSVTIEKKDEEFTLEMILDIFANPSIEHSRSF